MGAREKRRREGWGGRGTGGIRERKEWVMGVLKKWEFFHMLPCSRFFSPTFLVHQSLFSLTEPFTTINSASHLFNFQYSDQTIQTDLQSKTLDQNSTTVNQIHPRSDHHIPVPHQTILRPDNHQTIRSDRHHNTRPPDQIIPTDNHP